MLRGSNFKRPYPPEFRREAVALYRSGDRSLNEVAGDHGISTEPPRLAPPDVAGQGWSDHGAQQRATSGNKMVRRGSTVRVRPRASNLSLLRRRLCCRSIQRMRATGDPRRVARVIARHWSRCSAPSA